MKKLPGPGTWQSDHYSFSPARWPMVLREGDRIPPLLDLDSRLLAAARDWTPVQGWPVQHGLLEDDLVTHREWRNDPSRNRQWELRVASKARGRLWKFGSLCPDWERIPAARMGLELDVRGMPPLLSSDFDLAGFLREMESNPARDLLAAYHADATKPGPHMVFADMASGSPEDVLAFARRYGLPRVGARTGPQPYPLLVFAYDAFELELTARLAMAVVDVDRAEMRRLYISLSELQGRSREQAERHMEPKGWHSREPAWNEVVGTGEAAVMLQFNERLKSVRLSVGLACGFGAQEFRRWQGSFSTASLLDVCYLMLYWDLTSDRRLSRCANDRCAMLFYATRTDREYCSGSCQNAAAVRRHYWEQKGKQAKGTGNRKKRRARRKSKS